jgi:hypothetical protein
MVSYTDKDKQTKSVLSNPEEATACPREGNEKKVEMVEASAKPAKLAYTAEKCLGFGGQAKVYSVTVDE